MVIGIRVAVTHGVWTVRGVGGLWSPWFVRFLKNRRRCGRQEVNGSLGVKLAEGIAGTVRMFREHRGRGSMLHPRTRFWVGKLSAMIVRVIRSTWMKWIDCVLWNHRLLWWRGRRQWAGKERSRRLGHWCCSGRRIVRHLKIILRVIRTCQRFGWLGSCRGWSWCHCRVVERHIGVIRTRWILRRASR